MAGGRRCRECTDHGASGRSIALLLGMQQDACPVRKGAVWWIRTRERDGDTQTVVVTVQSPELI